MSNPKFCYKETGIPFRLDAWIEHDGNIVCKAILITVLNDQGDVERILIDGIDTPAEFRRKGYASFLVKTILANYPDSAPTTIDDNPRARAFWKKLGLEPALGWEDESEETCDACAECGQHITFCECEVEVRS